ncbi:hypothetical protein F52700_5414 [Fusarium sp. NRRL 52700]|nr:hypothetical protein F52700_5414 [Fusarium sp. NRRL 52700]
MKFILTTAALVLSLLGIGEAARIEIDKTTGTGLIPVYSSAYYGDDGKEYMLGAFNDGCRKTNYSWIRQICLDSGKERGTSSTLVAQRNASSEPVIHPRLAVAPRVASKASARDAGRTSILRQSAPGEIEGASMVSSYC